MTKSSEASAPKDFDNVTQVEFIKKCTWVMNTGLNTADPTDHGTVISFESLQIGYVGTPSFISVQHP